MKPLIQIFRKISFPYKKKPLFSTSLEQKEFIDQIIDIVPSLITSLKDSELSNSKIKQDSIYFRQRSIKYRDLKKSTEIYKESEIKKTLIYKMFFDQEIQKRRKNYKDKICYRDVDFLKIFLTRSGKIRSRRVTKLTRYTHTFITKLIKQSRSKKLIPLKFFIIS